MKAFNREQFDVLSNLNPLRFEFFVYSNWLIDDGFSINIYNMWYIYWDLRDKLQEYIFLFVWSVLQSTNLVFVGL